MSKRERSARTGIPVTICHGLAASSEHPPDRVSAWGDGRALLGVGAHETGNGDFEEVGMGLWSAASFS